MFILFKPSKLSWVFLIALFGGLSLYGLHYRSQYAIIEENISLFETYRYVTNLTPLILGYVLFAEPRKSVYKIQYHIIVGVIFFSLAVRSLIWFSQDEVQNYHRINSQIEDMIELDENVLVVDNFPLVSLINRKKEIDIIDQNSYENNSDLGKAYDKVIFINRFNIVDSIFFRGLDKLHEVSTRKTSVFVQ